MNKMLQKSLIGVAIVAVAVPILMVGGYYLDALVAAVIFFSAYEVASIKDQKPHWLMTLFVFFGVLLMTVLPTVHKASFMGIYMTLLVLIGLTDPHYDVHQLSIIFLVSIVITNAATALRYTYSSGMGWKYVILTLIACYVCDTMAYFFGSFIGKHKMIPRVSPNKTWEGAIGGYVSAAVVSLIYGFIVCIDAEPAMIWAIALILPSVAEIGDLAFSLIKRAYGVKDYGSLFPGHGGMLDRVDSYLFCLMVYGAIVMLFNGGVSLW